MSVTRTWSLSSIFFIKDLASSLKSLKDFTPAHSGNLTSNFVIANCVALLSIIALCANSKSNSAKPSMRSGRGTISRSSAGSYKKTARRKASTRSGRGNVRR